MKTHYSCAELASLRMPDYPTTERRFRDLVDRENWPFREEKSRGRGGLKRLYAPPANVLKLIRAIEERIATLIWAVREAKAIADNAPADAPSSATISAPDKVTLTVQVSFSEAAYITRWLERRGRK